MYEIFDDQNIEITHIGEDESGQKCMLFVLVNGESESYMTKEELLHVISMMDD